MRRWHKLFLLAIGLYLVLAVMAGVVISEGSLHLRRLPLRHRQEAEATVQQRYRAELQDVSIQAADAAVLKGWYIHPQEFNGSVVIVLHGITDNREGMAGFGKLFLDHGYAVLMPDARAHGESGGDIATYGLKESDDIHRWVSWIYAREPRPVQCVYGFGESYGAALILQSLADESRYCAVAAESAFSSARSMSYERISGPLHMGPWFGKTLGRPVVESAVLYARMRYGIDLLQPSPIDAVAHSAVPVLLIHGEEDRTISPWHSVRIANTSPGHVQLWLVPHAGHTMAWATVHQEFETRLLAWFAEHKKAVSTQQSAISN